MFRSETRDALLGRNKSLRRTAALEKQGNLNPEKGAETANRTLCDGEVPFP